MQSRLWSAIETASNIAIGFVLALISQLLIFRFYGIQMKLADNVAITAWFTVVSIVRSYALRRYFNKIRR